MADRFFACKGYAGAFGRCGSCIAAIEKNKAAKLNLEIEKVSDVLASKNKSVDGGDYVSYDSSQEQSQFRAIAADGILREHSAYGFAVYRETS